MKPVVFFSLIAGIAGLVILTNVIFGGVAKSSPEAATPTIRKSRAPAKPAFWITAQVPDPGNHRAPMVIRPEDLGVKRNPDPIDHAERIAHAISENDLPSVQSATLSWFEQDPSAARDWLASQPTLADLQPAISYIAHRISENGDLATALEWTAFLSEGTLRDDTVFGIHALALRNRKITVDEIDLDRIPTDRREELVSGAAGD